MNDGYLFPTPGHVLRSLLDRLDQSGEEWTEHQATVDIMLAMDRDDIRPYRYYAERWGWSKSRVYRHMEDLKERARQWRSFNHSKRTNTANDALTERQRDSGGTKRDSGGTSAGQVRDKDWSSDPQNGENGTQAGHQRDTSGTSAGQRRDSIEQTTEQSTDTRSPGACARGDGTTGDGQPTEQPPDLTVSAYGSELKDHPAVEAHRDAFPAVSLGQMQREKIASTVDDLDLWRQVLEEWALNDYRGRSIGRQLQKYQEDRNERSTNGDRGSGADRRGNQQDGHRRAPAGGSPGGRGGQWGDYA